MPVYDPARDSDKRRALVQLASSVAGQLANVANSLAAEANMLAEVNASQNLPAIAALVKRSAERTETIVSKLMEFTGHAPTKPRILSPTHALSAMIPMLHRMVGPSVCLTVQCADNVSSIYADPSQFEQIICTLVARARDAITDEGTVAIRATSLRRAEQINFDADYACIEVSDSGSEIPSPEQVFEPVLARKGHGLWLGLSTVYGAIGQIGGTITVETDSSSGTTFTILLPALPKL